MKKHMAAAGAVYIIFGLAYLPIGVLSKALNGDVLRLLTFRFLTASLAMGLLCLCGVFRVRFRGKRLWRLAGAGLLMPIFYYLCETYGLQQFPSSKAGILMAMAPVVATLLAMPVFGEVPRPAQWVCIGVSVAGAVLLNLKGLNNGQGTLLGFVLIALCAAISACNNVAVRFLQGEFSPMEIAFATTILGAVFFGALSLWQHGAAGTLADYFAPLADPRVSVSIFYLGVVSSTMALLLLNNVLGKLQMATAMGLSALGSVTAVFVGVLAFGESYTLPDFVGTILILGGVFGVTRYAAPAVPARRERDAT